MKRGGGRRPWRAWGLAAMVGVLAGGGAGEADAKSSYDSPYGFERTYNAATRLVRVDMGFKVVEKDDSLGYLLFDYKSPEGGSKPTPGSIELVRPRDATSPVHVIVQLPQMPRYHEQVLLDALVRKMRDEYGEPPKRERDKDRDRDRDKDKGQGDDPGGSGRSDAGAGGSSN